LLAKERRRGCSLCIQCGVRWERHGMASLLHSAECLGKETMVFAKLIQVCQGLA
jgi:hypothetical protein